MSNREEPVSISEYASALKSVRMWRREARLPEGGPPPRASEVWFNEVFANHPGEPSRALRLLKQCWDESSILPVGAKPSEQIDVNLAEKLAEELQRLIEGIFRTANSVAHLKLGAVEFTGFMIDEVYLATAAHCLPNIDDSKNVEIVFKQWGADGQPAGEIRCEADAVPTQPWKNRMFRNMDQDWTVFPLRPVAGGSRVPPGLTADPSGIKVDARVILIDCPNGGPQNVSAASAMITDVNPLPVPANASGGIIEHGQTVSGGSSGAPLLNLSLNVLGLQTDDGPKADPTHVAYNEAARIDLFYGTGPRPGTQISPGDIHMLQFGDAEAGVGTPPTSEHGRMYTYLGDERWFLYNKDDAGRTPKTKTFIPISSATPDNQRFIRFWFEVPRTASYYACVNKRPDHDLFRQSLVQHAYKPLECLRNVAGAGWLGAPGEHFEVWQGDYTGSVPSNLKRVGYVVWSDKQHWLLFNQNDPNGAYSKYTWINENNQNQKGTLKFVYLPNGIPQNVPSHEYVTCFNRDPNNPENWPVP